MDERRLFKVVLVMLLSLAVFIPLAVMAQDALSVSPAAAASPAKIDTGDTAWMLISTALVMLMTPGLAMFYGGMVRRKNVLGTIMHSFIAIALVSLQWILFGYSLSFGPDVKGIIGNLSWAGLGNVGLTPNADYAPTIPHLAVHGLSDDVRGHHAGAHQRGVCGADEVLHVSHLYPGLDHDRVRSRGPLGLGNGRMAEKPRGPRFCRRHRCACHIRFLRACGRALYRKAKGFSAGAYAAS